MVSPGPPGSDNLIFYICRRQEAATIFHSALVEIANLAQSRDAPFPFCLRNCDVWHHSLNALSERALSCSWWKGQQRCRADLFYSHSTHNPMRRGISRPKTSPMLCRKKSHVGISSKKMDDFLRRGQHRRTRSEAARSAFPYPRIQARNFDYPMRSRIFP